MNNEKNIDEILKYSDEGGEDQGPCLLAMPRGCVVWVACRTQSRLVRGKGGGGFQLRPGRL